MDSTRPTRDTKLKRGDLVTITPKNIRGGAGDFLDVMHIEQVARILGCRTSTVKELCKSKKLQSLDIGSAKKSHTIIRRPWLEAYLESIAAASTPAPTRVRSNGSRRQRDNDVKKFFQ